jgi:DNA-binding response OmpR family regulator
VANRRILVVEDDLDLRDSLQTLLESENYAVDLALDGEEALALLKTQKDLPDAILLDWMMPRMGGAEFCAERDGDSRLAKIPVVILTATGGIEDKIKKCGAALGLMKPVDVEALLSALNQAIKNL